MNEDREDTYRCKVCDEEWTFFPADFEKVEDYPDTCPLCEMSIGEMMRDIYRTEGAIAALKHLWIRVLKGKIR